jgi:hypothetical protein
MSFELEKPRQRTPQYKRKILTINALQRSITLRIMQENKDE